MCLTIAILPNESAFAIKIYTTLYQDLNGAQVVVATVLSKHVDSLSTLYSFRIDEHLSGSISDSVISVITFMGKNIWVEDEESFDVGRKYLLLFYRGRSRFSQDPVRGKIVRQSNAVSTIRSFPESQRDYTSALEATRVLIRIRLLNDSGEKTAQFLNLLESNNDYLIGSAIQELKRSKDTRSIPNLRRLSGRGSAMIRISALTGLYELGGKHEAPTFFASLQDTFFLVRQRALLCLIWSKTPIPEDTLIQIATNVKEDFNNRSIAMDQLLRVHSVRSIPGLEHLLVAEPNNREIKRTVFHIIDSLKTFLKK